MAHPLGSTTNNFRTSRNVEKNIPLKLHITKLILTYLLFFTPANYCDVSFQDASLVKPDLLLIAPQTLKLTSKDFLDSIYDSAELPGQDLTEHPQQNQPLTIDNYVAIVNNAPTERLDRIIRKQFPRLVLQVRELKHSGRHQEQQPGELVFEHVFDYFPEQTTTINYNTNNNEQDNLNESQQNFNNYKDNHTRSNSNFILIPINLDQVSHEHLLSISSGSARDSNGHEHSRARSRQKQQQQHVHAQQQLVVVSVRPYGNPDGGFGSDQIELVRSAPIPVEVIQSRNGQRSFGVVQTDKPIYKPDEQVRVRTFVVNEHLRPIGRDELRLQIKNPHKIIVEEVNFPREVELQKWAANPGGKRQKYFFDYTFEFPPEPMFGQWSVHLLHRDPIANDTSYFEVREYTLPTFEISFELPKYVLPLHQLISGHIVAKHHYGKPIRGKAQFKFGLRDYAQSPIKWVARSNIKEVDPDSGKVDFKLTTERIKSYDWFPTIANSRFVIEVSVTETTSGKTEIAQDSSTLFVSSPYRISFEDSIVDFKPGMAQLLTVQLNEVQTGQPARAGLKLEATYKDQSGNSLSAQSENMSLEAYTDSTGRASFKVGPIQRDSVEAITITIKGARTASLEPPSSQMLDLATLLPGDEHTLIRHESQQGQILLMNKTQTEMRVGDTFESDLLLHDVASTISGQRIFYLLVARSQILTMRTLDRDGFVRFKLTEQMVPRIRIVLIALTGRSVLSDSMRLGVNQDLGCAMKGKFRRSSDPQGSNQDNLAIFLPNTSGTLEIQARKGDVISLIGVDSAVHSLHNKTRSEPTRMLERIRRLDSGCGFGGGRNNLDVFLNAGLTLSSSSSWNGVEQQEGKLAYDKQHSPGVGSFCLTLQNKLRHLEDVQLGYRRAGLNMNMNGVNRKKRDAREKRIEQVIGKYKEFKLRACCHLGTFEDLPQQRNCSHRAKIVQRHMAMQLHQHHNPNGESSSEAEACAAAYLDCCIEISEQINIASVVSKGLTSSRRLPDDNDASGPSHYFDASELLNAGHLDRIESETLVRRDFRETWLFELVEASEETGLATIEHLRLPHSMTSWSISGLALNEAHSMCFMRSPLKLITFKEIFLQLSMPYKVVQGEQIDLIASVYNYSPEELHVVVYTYGVEGLCSDAEPGERSARRLLRLVPHSSQSLVYPMIPLKIGRFAIKLAAISMRSNTSDIVERSLRVVARGRPVADEITFSLDPQNQQRRGKRSIQTGNLIDEIDSQQGVQRSRIRLTPIRETDYIVPHTQECIVSAIGDRLGNSVQTSLLDVENLIKLPHGCGEQVMIFLGPTLYTARYLSSLDKLTGDLRHRSIRYIQSGYKRILNFRQESGAFAAFAGREPSIWLTSFVVKLLCQTEKFSQIQHEVRVDQNVINAALSWLIDVQNPTSGNWIELNPVYHREMLGGILKEDALTSFVTISLNECLHHSGQVLQSSNNNNNNLPGDSAPATSIDGSNHLLVVGETQPPRQADKLRVALQRAEEWLLLGKYRAVKEKNPYVLALSAYALSFNRPREATDCLNELWRFAQRNHAKNHLFWTGDYAIETSGYALSALVELAPLIGAKTNVSQLSNDAQSIANWLASRRSYTGAFESTQDTVVALEALSKLAQVQASSSIFSSGRENKLSASPGKASLSCQVNVSNRTKRSLEFDKHNAQILQTFKLETSVEQPDLDAGVSPSPLNGEILEVLTMGTGLGMMSVKLKYNVLQDDHEFCHFNIDASIEEWRNKAPATFNNHASELDLEGRSSLGANTPNAQEIAVELDYLNEFSRPMLSELNLVYHTQGEPEDSSSSLRKQQVSVRTLNRTKPVLRLRRMASDQNETKQQQQNWASKLVSNIRGKLSSLFGGSKSSQVSAEATPAAGAAQSRDLSANYQRRNNLRRATQNVAPPLVIRPTGIPQDAKFNGLSDKLELYPTQGLGSDSSRASNANSSQSDAGPRPVPHTALVNQLRICVDHISSRRDSEMSVIEVGILSGFQPNEGDLKSIIEAPSSLAMKYELSKDRSLLLFYLRHIPSGVPFCMQFRLIRDSRVHNLQSGYIRAYEYYTPKHSCTAYYTPLRQADPIETRCDQSSQVCECAARSSCPGIGGKMRDLGQIQETNSTSARQKLKSLVCSPKFDFVSLVQLRDVRELELGRLFKLTLKVKSDLRGNLTSIMEVQKQQQQQISTQTTTSHQADATMILDEDLAANSTMSPLESLTAIVDSSCVRNDPLLLHLAHPNQWRKSSDKMILFGRYAQLDKRFFKSARRATLQPQALMAKNPNLNTKEPSVISAQSQAKNSSSSNNQQFKFASGGGFSEFDANAQQLQYSTRIDLDRDSIIHDLKFNSNVDSALAAVDDLVRWLTIQVDHESWSCDQDVN